MNLRKGRGEVGKGGGGMERTAGLMAYTGPTRMAYRRSHGLPPVAWPTSGPMAYTHGLPPVLWPTHGLHACTHKKPQRQGMHCRSSFVLSLLKFHNRLGSVESLLSSEKGKVV